MQVDVGDHHHRDREGRNPHHYRDGCERVFHELLLVRDVGIEVRGGLYVYILLEGDAEAHGVEGDGRGSDIDVYGPIGDTRIDSFTENGFLESMSSYRPVHGGPGDVGVDIKGRENAQANTAGSDLDVIGSRPQLKILDAVIEAESGRIDGGREGVRVRLVRRRGAAAQVLNAWVQDASGGHLAGGKGCGRG